LEALAGWLDCVAISQRVGANFLLLKIVMIFSNYIQLLIGITKKLSEVDNPKKLDMAGLGENVDCI
tara:strand:- start:2229 stop:2426 length:198 start_codon:yes stop_codon:yes gene_type:complete